MGLLNPSKAEKAEAKSRAEQGDYSRFARMDKKDAQAMVDQYKYTLGPQLMASNSGAELSTKLGGDNATTSLNPVIR